MTHSFNSDEWVGVDELVRFFEGRGMKNAPQKARSTFFYLVEYVNHLLIVRCTECKKRYGECRCPTRGTDYGLGWTYAMFLDPLRVTGQYHWVIARQGLIALDPEHVPASRSARTRRDHVITFLEHLKRK